MNKVLRLLLLTGLTALSFDSFAQWDPTFTQFMFNKLYFNPGFTGMDQGQVGQLLYRNQWLGFATSNDGNSGAPNTATASGNIKLDQRNGLGAVAVFDQLGARQNIEFQLSYGRQFVYKGGLLGVGVRAGIYNSAIDGTKLRPIDRADPVYARISGREQAFTPDFAVGVYYNKPKWFLGAGVNHILGQGFTYGDANARLTLNDLSRHIYLMGGYNWDLADEWVLTTQAMSFTDLRNAGLSTVSLNGMFTYNKKFFFGGSYRLEDAFSGLVGLRFGKEDRFRFAYSIDFSLPNVQPKRLTSHEVSLAYLVPYIPALIRPAVRTPRYRM